MSSNQEMEGATRKLQYLHLCGTVLSYELVNAKVTMVEQMDTNSKRDLFAKMRLLGKNFDQDTLVPACGMTIGEIASLLQLSDKGTRSKVSSSKARSSKVHQNKTNRARIMSSKIGLTSVQSPPNDCSRETSWEGTSISIYPERINSDMARVSKAKRTGRQMVRSQNKQLLQDEVKAFSNNQ